MDQVHRQGKRPLLFMKHPPSHKDIGPVRKKRNMQNFNHLLLHNDNSFQLLKHYSMFLILKRKHTCFCIIVSFVTLQKICVLLINLAQILQKIPSLNYHVLECNFLHTCPVCIHLCSPINFFVNKYTIYHILTQFIIHIDKFYCLHTYVFKIQDDELE